MSDYIDLLVRELDFSDYAMSSIVKAVEAVEKQYKFEICKLISAYEANKYDFAKVSESIKDIAKSCDIHEYEANLVFLLAAAQNLEERYKETGYGRELFIATVKDLKYKCDECFNVHGVFGNFVPFWYRGFYDMTRFAIGRFQYEKYDFPLEYYEEGGQSIKKGDTVLNIPIPASGEPLCDEVRFDSYRRAKEFFYPNSPEKVPFMCISWLLWEPYEDYIPERLNLKRFRRDFNIISATRPSKSFENGWRVFGAASGKPYQELPKDTSQRRLFAEYIKDGGEHGTGYGVFFF